MFVQVRGGQLWGTDIYTDDSDLVAGTCLKESLQLIPWLGPDSILIIVYLSSSSHAYRLLSAHSFPSSTDNARVACNHPSLAVTRMLVIFPLSTFIPFLLTLSMFMSKTIYYIEFISVSYQESNFNKLFLIVRLHLQAEEQCPLSSMGSWNRMQLQS